MYLVALGERDRKRWQLVNHIMFKLKMGQKSSHPTPITADSLIGCQDGEQGKMAVQEISSSDHDVQDRICWEINYADLEFIKVIGRDAVATSWKGKWRGCTEVEIKKAEGNKNGIKELVKQAEGLRGLRHPNLLSVVGVCTEAKQTHVVVERPLLCHHLQTYLKKTRPSAALPFYLHIVTQVASGLAYLESHDLICLEVNARNILMTSDLVCKVEVFGLIKKNQDVVMEDMLCPMWTAPEVMTSGITSLKGSVWTFGVFMLEVLKGGQLNLHDYLSNRELMKQVDNGRGFPAPDNCPPGVYKLMKTCWLASPDKRPTFTLLQESLRDAAAVFSEEDVKMCSEMSA